MLTLRPRNERGHANHGWLDTWHTFSFNTYYDPAHMGFRGLRVINEDIVAPAQGFGTHGHQDMEILTYVLDGELQHRDSIGEGGVIRHGEVQHMSAGSGVRHSEFNASSSESVHLLQIWIEPKTLGIRPSYSQQVFPIATELNQLHLIASENGREGSLPIEAGAELRAAKLTAGASVEHVFERAYGWLQLARGSAVANGVELVAGDGLALSDEAKLAVTAGTEGAEFLLFDLA
jgi:hypothetical protein